MNSDFILTLGQNTFRVMAFVAGPLLIASMLIGIVISILQAITQIQEATLTFIPKMIAVMVVFIVLAPWMIQILQEYTIEIFSNVQWWIR